MPSPLVACPPHRDDSRTSSGHQRGLEARPANISRRQGFRSARLSEGRSALGTGRQCTRKLLSPPAFRSRVRRERARTLLGSRRLQEKEKDQEKGRRRPFLRSRIPTHRSAARVCPSPRGACAMEGIDVGQPRRRSCA
jgi:hypothetical protein